MPKRTLGLRIALVTGKGGVGKTTVAAALAKVYARKGRRTLCAEVVPDEATPSLLAEAMGGAAPGEQPRQVGENLWAVLLTPGMGHRRFLQNTLPVKVLADAAMRSSAIRKFLAAAPGFGDMGVMYRMLDLAQGRRPDGSFEFEACVIDSPATGHALALAQLPELLLRVIPAGPIGRTAREGLALLTDPVSTGAIVVTLPETLPVTEALELCAGLESRRVKVAAIVLNQVPIDPFTEDERAELERLVEARGVFGVRELRRIDRAAAAIRFLKERSSAPLLLVPELPGRGPALTEAVADALERGFMTEFHPG